MNTSRVIALTSIALQSGTAAMSYTAGPRPAAPTKPAVPRPALSNNVSVTRRAAEGCVLQSVGVSSKALWPADEPALPFGHELLFDVADDEEWLPPLDLSDLDEDDLLDWDPPVLADNFEEGNPILVRLEVAEWLEPLDLSGDLGGDTSDNE